MNSTKAPNVNVCISHASLETMVRMTASPEATERRRNRFAVRVSPGGALTATAVEGAGRGAVRVRLDATVTDTPDGARVTGVFGPDGDTARLAIRILAVFVLVVTVVTVAVRWNHGLNVWFTVGTLAAAVILWVFARAIGRVFARPVGNAERERMEARLRSMFVDCDDRQDPEPRQQTESAE
jgi:hypothetical protein